jgi:hypothetical protein
VGSTGGHHYVIDRRWEIPEERLQAGRIVDVKGRGALRVELECCLFEAFRIAPGEDDTSALGAGSPGGFQSDARAATDDDHGLAEQFRWALPESGSGYGCQDSSGRPHSIPVFVDCRTGAQVPVARTYFHSAQERVARMSCIP